MPQVFNIPKVEHDQPCSTLVVIVFQICLIIYVILGPDWSMAKVKVNKQTNLQKQQQPKMSMADHAQQFCQRMNSSCLLISENDTFIPL